MKTKACINKTCKQTNPQPLTNFHKNVARKDGLSGTCKACAYERRKIWTQNNREKDLTYGKLWRENNPLYSKDYAKKHADIIAKRKREWYKDNQELVYARSREWAAKNKEKMRTYKRAYELREKLKKVDKRLKK